MSEERPVYVTIRRDEECDGSGDSHRLIVTMNPICSNQLQGFPGQRLMYKMDLSSTQLTVLNVVDNPSTWKSKTYDELVTMFKRSK